MEYYSFMWWWWTEWLMPNNDSTGLVIEDQNVPWSLLFDVYSKYSDVVMDSNVHNSITLKLGLNYG